MIHERDRNVPSCFIDRLVLVYFLHPLPLSAIPDLGLIAGKKSIDTSLKIVAILLFRGIMFHHS